VRDGRGLDFDVAIVGGGPAGTSTALFLARVEGILPSRIVMLEKATHPREKPCAGAVSAWGLEALDRVGFRVAVPAVTMRGLRILDGLAVGAHAGELPGDALGIVVRRSELDESLWRAAENDGVAAHDGEGVLGLDRVSGGWRVVTSRRSITARHVIACDGAGSTVRKLLALREPARKGHLYVLETELLGVDQGPSDGLCDFDLGPANGSIEGYYWDFPTTIAGERCVSRGIYHANFTPAPGGGRDVKKALASALSRRGLDIDKVRLKPFSTRPFVERTTLLREGIPFVGEAAGIDATTGEGIAQAILFGEIAARHIACALRTGPFALEAYPLAVRRSRMGRHLLQSAWLARAVYGHRGRAYRSLLVRSQAAREAGARWYKGDKVGIATKLRLAALLAREVAQSLAVSPEF
jgi:flavin-dependent dehydrogenase